MESSIPAKRTSSSDPTARSNATPKAVSVAEARERIVSYDGFREDDYGCWLWENPASSGFGPFVSFYEAAHGPLPDDKSLSWRCRAGQNGCVNPDHMQALTADEHRKAKRQLPERDRKAWARAIRTEREARGWSRARLGRELGVADRTIRSWEEGSIPRERMQRIIAHVLGWEAQPRKFVVTTVVQKVVVASSAAEAVVKVNVELDESDLTKRETYSVRVVK